MIDELRKLLRPAVFLTLLFTLGAAFALIGVAQASDADQWSVVGEGLRSLDSPAEVAEFCAAIQASGPECAAQVAEQERDYRAFSYELIRDEPFGALMQQPGASLGISSGLFASWIGLLACAVLASFHVTGEWSGTARVLLSGRVSRSAFYVLKWLSVLLAAAAMMLVLSLSLALLTFVLRSIYDVAPLSSEFSPLAYSLDQALRTLPSLVLFATIAVTASFVARGTFGPLAVAIVFGALSLILASQAVTVRWSPAYWTASVAQFDPRGALRDHVWPSTFPVGATENAIPLNALLGGLATGGCILLLFLLGLYAANAKEVK